MMRTHAPVTRLGRLDELRGLLRSRAHSTVAALATELGVSARTIHRDLTLLRDTGVPVEAERGRGGGIRLHPNWAMGRLQFSTTEAIDLLVSIAMAEQMNSPILLRQLSSLKRKIVAAFGETHQRRIRVLRRRIFIGPPASARVAATCANVQRPVPELAETFLHARAALIEYTDRNGTRTAREIEPHFLYLSMPVWYILAWDRLRSDIRHFRADRIRAVKPLAAEFRVADPGPYIHEIELRLSEL